MEKLRIGIIGCGGIANGKHMPALRTQAEKAEMVAFCDIVAERAEKAAKDFGRARREGLPGLSQAAGGRQHRRGARLHPQPLAL